jgi:hypothetical protein
MITPISLKTIHKEMKNPERIHKAQGSAWILKRKSLSYRQNPLHQIRYIDKLPSICSSYRAFPISRDSNNFGGQR